MGLPSNPENPERRIVKRTATTGGLDAPYRAVFGDVSKIIDAARESAVRSVNAAMTAAYWLIGRRIVEFEQSGEERAEYGAALIERLAEDLTVQFGRGFSLQNIYNMRLFYLSYQPDRILQTLSGKSAPPPGRQILQTASGEFDPPSVELGFDDLWSAYVRLLSVRNESARQFYETEALRGGWSVRQIDRQIGSRFYERTALSKNRAAMLTGGQRKRPEDIALPGEQRKRPEDIALPGEQIKDPFVLEFLDLRDEYSESDLEESLIRHLETFLLELGDDFCFMGRQRRLRVGGRWYRVDLLFYHRSLRTCLQSLKYDKLRRLPEGGVIMSHSYPSDINREQFTRILPDLESARRRTKPRTVDLYDVFCGVLYLLKSGCQWRMLPADFPNWGTCYQYFQQWSERPDPEQESILEQVLKKNGWRGPEKQWSERAEQLLHRGLPERQEHGQRRAEGL